MRFLAFQLKRIGDLVLTTPALRALKSADPSARVTLVVTETTAPLLPAMTDFVDEALIYRSRSGSNRSLWLRLLRGGFDASVDFTGRDRSALMTLAAHAPHRLTARSALRKGGWRRLCYNVIAENTVRSRHTVDHYLDYVAALGSLSAQGTTGPETVLQPVLRVPPEAAARARELLSLQKIAPGDDFVVVHPGTARPEKYWVPERWAQVIDFCQNELGRLCVLTGGRGDPDEEAHLAKIRAALARPCADLSGQLDLLTLTAVLTEAGLVLGVDSGPMHLAAAGRRPQIVLFGPTNPFHWRPRHPEGLVLQAGHGDRPLSAPGDFAERCPRAPVDVISTDAVIACIRNLLPPPAAQPLSVVGSVSADR